MALVIADRVRETSVTSGTADIALGGAVTGFQSFATIGNGNTTYYCIAGQGTNEWEVGIGTYVSGTNTLERTTVLSNSAGTAPSKINFLSGVKDVFVTYPAEKSVDSETAQTLTNKTLGSGTAITSGTINGAVIGGSTPAAGTFTTLTSNSTTTLNGTTIPASKTLVDTDSSQTLTNKAFNGTIGGTTPAAGSFTTLSASSTVSGTGFSNYLASPPAIGGTTAAAGTFTNLSYTGSLTGGTGVINIGSGQFYKDASGNVGIGTAGPVSKLEVISGSIAKLIIGYNNTSENYFDANLNIFRSANGSERMRITATGDFIVGGTDTNGVKLTVQQSNPTNGILAHLYNVGTSSLTGSQLQFTQNTIDNWVIGQPAGTSAFAFWVGKNTSAAGTEVMRITSGGNVQTTTGKWIGTSSGASYVPDDGVFGGTINNGGGFKIATGGAESVRINNVGTLYVNTTGDVGINARFQVHYTGAGTQYGIALRPGTDNTTAIWFANASSTGVGTITVTTSTTSYNTSSDYRLKESIAPMTGALAKNELLNPVTYKWKSDGSDGQGFIAHELQAVFPDAVTGEKDAVDDDGKPVYQGVDTSFLVGHLVACVKELTAELNNVKAELAILKGA